MTTLRMDMIVPTAEGVETLKQWIAHVESAAWPEQGFMDQWLASKGYTETTDIVAILGPQFGSESKVQQLLLSCVLYENHKAKDKLLSMFRAYLARGEGT